MIHVVDAHSPPDPELPPVTSLAPPIVAVITDTDRPPSPYWLGLASFTLTESPTDDPRCVRVDSIDDSLAVIESGCTRMPITAATTADVFRVVNTDGDVRPALVTESLAYSTLQSGPEFAQWMAERGPTRIATDPEEPVVYERDGDALRILFNRPYRHNAFTDAMRIRLLEALTVAQLDTSITDVEIRGAGRSFCSGGDLAEFGAFENPAASHLARTRHSPALALDALRGRLGSRCRAIVHGQVLGSGLEMAAYCGRVTAHRDARLGLPELSVGLVPGAGGTYSISRRIGRWRSAYLVLSGHSIDASTALEWGLVDDVVDDAG
ncbi:enoyl-CoA hydratase/isomerase family protein [Gordonia sp. NPDC003376]